MYNEKQKAVCFLNRYKKLTSSNWLESKTDLPATLWFGGGSEYDMNVKFRILKTYNDNMCRQDIIYCFYSEMKTNIPIPLNKPHQAW